ncbi:MAG: endonuclease/exonuclease/phosphatase family protein [Alphaproteobacteria bacterium]|nr:endonuclease/exonuclease/phosphatase family protein [Alphaproteobacteria bacterium]
MPAKAQANIFDPPPPPVRKDMAAMRAALDNKIPAKLVDRNLLIATWNIRKFGGLTRKWTAADSDSPKRDLRGLLAIAEIISRFDVVAVQEVGGDLRALRTLMKVLGPNWGFVMTDVTLGKAGAGERLAFVFDQRRVQLSGLAAELVVPPEQIAGGMDQGALNRQFVRTPYAVSFRAGQDTFILTTLHVIYGHNAADREPELRAIAKWLADWSKRTNKWHQNFIVMGDFNIDRKGDLLWQAFTSTDLMVPKELHNVPRTVTASKTRPQLEKFYDQIAWFAGPGAGKNRLGLEYAKRGGYFDFLRYVYGDKQMTAKTKS